VRAEIAPTPDKARNAAPARSRRWIHNNGATDFETMSHELDKGRPARAWPRPSTWRGRQSPRARSARPARANG